MNFGFTLSKDFPYPRFLGFFGMLFFMFFSRSIIEEYYIDIVLDGAPFYALHNTDGDILIIFTELSLWILLLILYVAVLVFLFIIPLTLHFRGLSSWEWDPTTVVFWLITTRGVSLFLTEIKNTNPNLEDFVDILITIVDSIFILFLTVFLLRSYTNFFVPVMSEWLHVGKSDTQYGPILDIIGSLLIITFGVTNFLSTFHVDFGVLLAGVGVVGLVIALAAQDTLSNFFSGILLLLDQGFKTGDMIKFEDTYCIIREVGLRSTKIYDIINHVIIIIPNNSLANQNIRNLTKPDRYYRLRIEVGASYGSDPRKVEKALLEVAKQNKDIEQDDPTRLPLVRFQEFADSALNFALVVWIKNVIKIRQINSDLHHEVFGKLAQEEITIAFPQRDVHLYEPSKQAPKKVIEEVVEEPEKKAELIEGQKARQEAQERAKQAEEEVRQAEESARQAEEERAQLEAEEAKKQAEEAAKKAEEEKSQKAVKEAKIAEDVAKKAEEEMAKIEANEIARKAEDEEARLQAEKEAEEAARLVEEEKAQREAEEAAILVEEEKARKEAEKAAEIAEEKKAKLEAEEAVTRKLIEDIKGRRNSED
jgi:small-conductance mechanosensitive channel